MKDKKLTLKELEDHMARILSHCLMNGCDFAELAAGLRVILNAPDDEVSVNDKIACVSYLIGHTFSLGREVERQLQEIVGKEPVVNAVKPTGAVN